MKQFDLVISFAGEDRRIAAKLAKLLAARKVRVFYDADEQAELLGEDLVEYLTDVYKNNGLYCVALLSSSYKNKRWTRVEWRAAQARSFQEMGLGYLLPIKIDQAEFPDLLPTVGYLSLEDHTLEEISEIIWQKIKSGAKIAKTVRLARSMFLSGKYKEVCRILSEDKIMSSKYFDLDATRLLSDAYMHVGEFDLALSAFEKITAKYPKDGEALFLRGVCEARLKKFENAAKSYRASLAVAPFNGTARDELLRVQRLLKTKKGRRSPARSTAKSKRRK